VIIPVLDTYLKVKVNSKRAPYGLLIAAACLVLGLAWFLRK
jgi:hypothetical protein